MTDSRVGRAPFAEQPEPGNPKQVPFVVAVVEEGGRVAGPGDGHDLAATAKGGGPSPPLSSYSGACASSGPGTAR